MRILARGVVALVLLLGLGLGASVWVSRPAFDQRLDPALLDSLPIAEPAEALSFARARLDAGQPEHTVLVRAWRDGRVRVVPIGVEDPIALLATRGYESLRAQAAAGVAIELNPQALGVPFAAREHNVAVGLNYREHAQESDLDEEPFLFPKLAQPTAWNSVVARGASTRLDYEVELGLVVLRELRPGEPVEGALGLVLSNELTDRWPLVRGFDGDAPMGTTGFADGKSREGFAPLGPLLVVPRDFAAYWPKLELSLWRSGRLRQRERAASMVWPPERIVAEAFARAALPYAYRGGTIALLPDAAPMRPGLVIFTGTPAGVIFRPLNVLNPWVYLQAGDELVLRAEGLGMIRNRIEP